jgi:signal transduction protein with GAF and PtsI domain
MTLDTLVRVLGTECCWVQTIDSSRRSLQLVAERGLNSEMRREVSALDMARGFGRQVVGLASAIVIPDLSRDGRYGLTSFRTAGYKWMVAVPLMTYRVHGVLGVASRDKKRLRKETPDLALVIAGLIGTALNRAGLSAGPAAPEKPRQPATEAIFPPLGSPRQEKSIEANIPSIPPRPPQKNGPKPEENAFDHHADKMSAFRHLHH